MVGTSAPPLSATLAKELKALHQPGHPVVLANIYDVSSLSALLSLNTSAASVPGPVRAIATASYAIAETLGVRDADLTFEQHFAALEPIAMHLRTVPSLPLSIDLQDGYGERLEECMRRAVSLGAVGANIEDSIPERGFEAGVEGSLRSTEEQVRRIEAALRVAAEMGVPDFVINARTDVMRLAPRPEGAMEETVRRGKAFLEAGATTVFVWGGSQGLSRAEVERLVAEFGGRLAVLLSRAEDGLTVKELAAIGVARISVGPSLWMKAMEALKLAAARILAGGKLYA
ncbi:phosphoenolpyruvate phosphomutase-domain-containing protein [Mycena galopus ATCC 62051]|nr:phosphoenolpyruvate phosphomutase-domain-containing protein [Mycena galopus ATCC 62051]